MDIDNQPVDQELIDKINRFQQNRYFHPMTCTCGTTLVAKEHEGKIVLACPKEGCDYIQDWIPTAVGLGIEIIEQFGEGPYHE